MTGHADGVEVAWSGRACRDEPWLWDDLLDGEWSRATRRDRLETARVACLSCPALGPCTEWLAGAEDVSGVIAGRFVNLTRRPSHA